MSGQIKKILAGQVYKRISGQLKENMQYSKTIENVIRTSNGVIYAFDQKTRALKIVQDFRK
ncbi:TPA: hypothetical protein ACNFOO_000065 [Acinetobacter baumannii]